MIKFIAFEAKEITAKARSIRGIEGFDHTVEGVRIIGVSYGGLVLRGNVDGLTVFTSVDTGVYCYWHDVTFAISTTQVPEFIVTRAGFTEWYLTPPQNKI